MANSVEINKTVYDKEKFDKVVDRSFTTFAQPPVEAEEMTVEEFFAKYEELFFEIAVEGDTLSHQYLVQRSGELIDYDQTTEDIQPLLDEIAQLRVQVLDYQQQLIEANTPDQ